jgi:cytochrome c553
MPVPPSPSRIAAALLSAAALASAMAAAEGATPPDTLPQRIIACTNCHAAREKTDAFFPRISGKPAGYLYNQLLNFREGRRQYPLMTYMVDHLPDAYLHEIADYFAGQHPSPPPAKVSQATAAVLERGHAIVTQGERNSKVPACIACHGEQLAGALPAVPGLLGLPRDYINAQFGAWKNKVRRAAAPDCMAAIAARLSDADVAAVSSWLATQAARGDARPAASVTATPPLQCGSFTTPP